MATAAEPRPAVLPLPGGRDNTTVGLRPLQSGEMKVPPAALARTGTGRMATRAAAKTPLEEWVDVPVTAFLVSHPSAGYVLIDTGLHPSVGVDPAEAMGRHALVEDIRMRSEDSIPAQLRAIGVEPAEVGTVVMTDLRPDHAGAISEFPNATFVLDKREWEAAARASERDGYLRRQFDHAFDFRLLDFEGPAASSFATFGGGVDLFGDRSVHVVATPGHTAGHCSVVLRLRDREALICGAAAATTETIEGHALPLHTEDDHRFERSLGEVRRYLQQTPDALVVPGQDMRAWVRLDLAY